MVYTYTAILTPSEGGGKYYAKVPDIPGCVTSGKDLQDAIKQVTDALNGCLVVLEDNNVSPAPASSQSELEHEAGDVLTLVQADTIAYRAMTDTKSVRKNVSLPAWMAMLADKRGINCSQLLQEALLRTLS